MKNLLLLGLLLGLGSELQAQTQSPQQVLVAMEKCREQVINQLSLGDKMKMRDAMNAIQGNPRFVAANKAVTDAPTPAAQIEARKNLAKVKLDLIEQQDPSLKPVVEKIRAAQASILNCRWNVCPEARCRGCDGDVCFDHSCLGASRFRLRSLRPRDDFGRA